MCFVIISFFSAADAQWFWQNPVPQDNGLTGVKFISANTGWAAGFYGTIIKITDGGNHWTLQFSGTTFDLYGVFSIDQNTETVVGNGGTIAGSYGTILRTTNGGVVFVNDASSQSQPTGYLVSQNYPNPFNPATMISC